MLKAILGDTSLTKPPFGGDLGGLVVINCPEIYVKSLAALRVKRTPMMYF